MSDGVGAVATVGSHLCAYVEQSAVPRLRPGEAGRSWLRLRNIGTATWRRGGPHPVVLATDRPQDRASELYDAETWPSANRLARLAEEQVEPGGIGTFATVLRAPRVPGSYREAVRPVAEGIAWLNDLELVVGADVVVPTLEGAPELAAELVEPVPALVARPGEQRRVVVRLRNVGRVRWCDRGDEYGPLVQLGTIDPLEHAGLFHDPGSWIGPARPARVAGFVLPGECAELAFTVIAPARPGQYEERYGLVAELVSWFAEPAVSVRVLVV